MTATPGDRRLGSVLVPCLSSDLPVLEQTFAFWSDPRFLPLVSDECPKPSLLIVYNMADEDLIARTHALYAKFPVLQACFDKIEVFSADLEGDRDLYVRDSSRPEGVFGNKAGPNFLFQQAMHIAAEYGLYTFQIELDCLPLRPNWLHDLYRMLTPSDAWVIGSPYLGDAPLDPSIQFHINGNALYRCGSPHFLTFLDNIWIKNVTMLREVYPNLAYDCWWALQMTRSDASSSNAAWQLWQEYCFFFQYNAFVVNLTVGADQASQYTTVYDKLVEKQLRPLFFHGAVMRNVIAILCEDTSMTIDQALADFEKETVNTHRKDPENASEEYLFLAGLDQKYYKAPPPRVQLRKGFHLPEGPSSTYFPTRYAWSNASRLQISLADIRRDLTLFFREGRGRNLHGIENLQFSLIKQGREIPCSFDILEVPVFGALHLHGRDIKTPGLLEITSSIDTFTETNGERTLSLLFFEIGCRFGARHNESLSVI